MISSTLKSTLDRLQVTRSLSRPGVSDDNAFPESLFRMIKYRPNYPRRPLNLNGWCTWVKGFVSWYNEEYYHSGISYVTPSKRHQGLDVELLQARQVVYLAAQSRNPKRWSKAVRSWSRPAEARLAPVNAA